MIYVRTSFQGEPFEGVHAKSEPQTAQVMWIVSPKGILKMVEGTPVSLHPLSEAESLGISELAINKALRYLHSRIVGIERDRQRGLCH